MFFEEPDNLTILQFNVIVKYIYDNGLDFSSCLRGKDGGKMIKYIKPTFDTRTNSIYRVEFICMGGKTIDFTRVNENRNKIMYNWIMEWLMSN